MIWSIGMLDGVVGICEMGRPRVEVDAHVAPGLFSDSPEVSLQPAPRDVPAFDGDAIADVL